MLPLLLPSEATLGEPNRHPFNNQRGLSPFRSGRLRDLGRNRIAVDDLIAGYPR